MMCLLCESLRRQSLRKLALYAIGFATSLAESRVFPHAWWKNVAGAPGFLSAETTIRTGGSSDMLEMHHNVLLLELSEQKP